MNFKKIFMTGITAIAISGSAQAGGDRYECMVKGSYRKSNGVEEVHKYKAEHRNELTAKRLAFEACKDANRENSCDFKRCSVIDSNDDGHDGDHFGEWYSRTYNKYFDKNGECMQYDRTDRETCQTGKDNISCEWNSRTSYCDAGDEDSNDDDHFGEWYSRTYNKYFDKNGECMQYDRTDRETCQTRKDNISCEWNSRTSYCDPGHEDSHHDRDFWYSSRYKRYFEIDGQCRQYDNTDSRTCDNNFDKLNCFWSERKQSCYQD